MPAPAYPFDPACRAARVTSSAAGAFPSRPLLAVALALLPWAAALAQGLPPTLPPGAEPGRTVPAPPMPEPAPTLRALDVPAPVVDDAQAPPGAERLAFTLAAVQLDGATAYGAGTFEPLWSADLGRTVTVAQAWAWAKAIERRYRADGYVTSRVIVPAQTIGDGTIRLRVVEGTVDDIVVEAEGSDAGQAVQRLLAPLRGQRPVSVAAIERRLLLANDLAGLTVRATLEPSPTTQGGSVLVARVARVAQSFSAGVNNRLSPYLGGGEVKVGWAAQAVGARADRYALGLSTSTTPRRSLSVNGAWDTLLGADGTTLGVTLSGSQARPGRELDVVEVRSRVRSAELSLTHPIVRSRDENLRAVGQLELRDVDTDLVGTPYTRDRLRILRGGFSWDRADAWDGVTAARVMLHLGLAGLGASERGQALASRPQGRPDFQKLTAELTRVQQLAARTSLLATMSGQWSRHPLLASEEMSLGGSAYARAYDGGEIAADRGIAASIELRHVPEATLLPALLPTGLQVYGWLDGGRLSAHPQGAPLTGARSLASWGGGLRAPLAAPAGSSLFATLEIAKPISADVRTQGDKHPRAFVSLVATF